jgi:anti-sigma factor RsiW
MSCEYKKEILEAYAAGALDTREQVEVKDHIRSCSSCRAELTGLQRAVFVLEKAFDEEAPDWLAQKTLAVLKAKSKRSFTWFAWSLPALAGAAAVVLLFIAMPGIKSRFDAGTGAPCVSQAAKKSEENDKAAAMDSRGAAGTAVIPAAAPLAGIPGEFTIAIENPVNDRSIYEDLGVAKKVANLLL